MGKNKKKVTHTKKEEEQAKRVIKIISISLVILALAMIIGFSFVSRRADSTINGGCAV